MPVQCQTPTVFLVVTSVSLRLSSLSDGLNRPEPRAQGPPGFLRPVDAGLRFQVRSATRRLRRGRRRARGRQRDEDSPTPRP